MTRPKSKLTMALHCSRLAGLLKRLPTWQPRGPSSRFLLAAGRLANDRLPRELAEGRAAARTRCARGSSEVRRHPRGWGRSSAPWREAHNGGANDGRRVSARTALRQGSIRSRARSQAARNAPLDDRHARRPRGVVIISNPDCSLSSWRTELPVCVSEGGRRQPRAALSSVQAVPGLRGLARGRREKPGRLGVGSCPTPPSRAAPKTECQADPLSQIDSELARHSHPRRPGPRGMRSWQD